MTNSIDTKLCNTKHEALMKIAELCSDKLSLRIGHLEELMKERKENLELRLEALNQLRQEVTKDRDQFMRSETYLEKVKWYDQWVSDTNRTLTEMKTRYDSRIGLSNWLAIGALLVSIAVGIILLLKG